MVEYLRGNYIIPYGGFNPQKRDVGIGAGNYSI